MEDWRVRQLVPGDQVKIVDEWVEGCNENSDGDMDKWLGEVMTVRSVEDDEYDGPIVHMEEDIEELFGCGWSWFPPAIEDVIEAPPLSEPTQRQLEDFLRR